MIVCILPSMGTEVYIQVHATSSKTVSGPLFIDTLHIGHPKSALMFLLGPVVI